MNDNKFIFYDEQQDSVIQQIDIPNEFVDWVDELKEVFFEKDAVLKQMHFCLERLTVPQVVMYQEGL